MNFNKLKKTFIIAEIGNNHEGSFEVACKLIKEAKKAGADAVKFQTFETKNFINVNEIQRFERLKKFELTKEEFYKLSLLAKKNNLKFISTPFDINSAIFLNKIVDCFKISSGDNNYYQLIEQVIKFRKSTIISTGLLNFKEIINLYKFVKKLKIINSKIAFLHCVSSYPVKDNEANLLSISFLKKKFPFTIGYSDHTLGIHAAIAASALGAKIIEKHFTLDNNYSKFRDHQLSANPHNMKYLVDSIRSLEKMMGNENKFLQPSEKKVIHSMRRSLYMSKNIVKNSKINKVDVSILRPFVSLEPADFRKVIGKTTKVNLDINMPIFLRNLKN
jgi:N-acetylneuraminate synthase/N,N'-diacetyllegionaminate synthase